MKINHLCLMLFILIIIVNLYYCNNEQEKNNNVADFSNEKNTDDKNTVESKYRNENKKNTDDKNTVETYNESEITKDNDESDAEKMENSDTVEKIKHFNKEKLEKWSESFLKHMKSFSDKEITEKKLVKEGKGLINVYDQYLDLYIELEDIQKLYNENVGNPPKELPKVAYDTFKVCKDSYNKAMDKRIKSIENIILFIDSLKEREGNGEGEVIDSTGNEALNKYQQYTIDYDELIKKILIALKDIYMKLGYEVNFGKGKITKMN